MYPKPIITADVLVISGAPDKDNLKILLIQRAKDPFKDCWAIPGGHFNPEPIGNEPADGTIFDAAWRELKEETGVSVPKDQLKLFRHYDEIGRDPRGRYVTFVWYTYLTNPEVKADDDAKDFRWFAINKCGIRDLQHGPDCSCGIKPVGKLAFDHEKIIADFCHGIWTPIEKDKVWFPSRTLVGE